MSRCSTVVLIWLSLVVALLPRTAFAQTGACCEGSVCALRTGSVCTFVGGTFLGVGTSCTPNPCSGACCDSDGVCVVASQQACRGESYVGGQTCSPNPCPQSRACCVGGACTFILPSTCAGTVQNAGVTCSPNPCTRACCTLSGTCTVVSAAACSASGGAWTGGATCAAGACQVQACCGLDILCVLQSSLFPCSGAYSGTICAPSPCQTVIGACCHTSTFCSMTTEAQCTALFRPGDLCSTNPCPVPCCLPGGACQVFRLGDCIAFQGNPAGTCTPNTCPVACCSAFGCTVVTAAQCGDIVVGSTSCNPTPCPPRACCLTNFTCVLSTTCTSGMVIGSTCSATVCNQVIGSCCESFATCSVTTSTNCSGGFLAGQPCFPSNPCPALCCLPNVGCVGRPVGVCEASGGTVYLAGGCTCTGACCAAQVAGCVILSATDCQSLGLTFLGPDTTCSPQNCPARGACCSGAACTITDQTACTGGSVFLGRGTSCQPAARGGAFNPCCRTDFNASGAASVQDIFDFLAAYFAGCP